MKFFSTNCFFVILKKDFMGAIVIKSRNTKNLKLLSDFAEQLGETVDKLTTAEAEDIKLGLFMKKEKTGKSISRAAIFKHLNASWKYSLTNSFHKGLIKIKEKAVLDKIKHIILVAEEAADVQHIPNIKKMEGFKTFYRIRIGDYRIGIELKKDSMWFITVADRKDIYKHFPWYYSKNTQ